VRWPPPAARSTAGGAWPHAPCPHDGRSVNTATSWCRVAFGEQRQGGARGRGRHRAVDADRHGHRVAVFHQLRQMSICTRPWRSGALPAKPHGWRRAHRGWLASCRQGHEAQRARWQASAARRVGIGFNPSASPERRPRPRPAARRGWAGPARPRRWSFSGSSRMRLPVAAKIAFSTAGAATAMVGSPTPPQKPPVGTSTSRPWASAPSQHRVGVEVLLLDARRPSPCTRRTARPQAVDEAALDLRLDLLRVDGVAGSVAATMRCTFSSPSALTETSAQAAT
jgi:hypothetical protein